MKLKGFTIMELIMVMALMSIIVGLGYAARNILEDNFIKYDQQSDELMESVNFSVFIEKDFNDAKKVTIQDDRLILDKKDIILEYTFDEDKIYRNAFIGNEKYSSDIDIQNVEIETFFQRQLIHLGLIDFCKINYEISGIKNTITLQKQYSSDELIHYQEYVH